MQGRTEAGTMNIAERIHGEYMAAFCAATTPNEEKNAVASALSELQYLFDVPCFGENGGLAPALSDIVDMWGEAAHACGVLCDMPYPTH